MVLISKFCFYVYCWITNVELLKYMFDLFFFFFKHKTAYEMRISDWSSDVCSSDLGEVLDPAGGAAAARADRRQRAGGDGNVDLDPAGDDPGRIDLRDGRRQRAVGGGRGHHRAGDRRPPGQPGDPEGRRGRTGAEDQLESDPRVDRGAQAGAQAAGGTQRDSGREIGRSHV